MLNVNKHAKTKPKPKINSVPGTARTVHVCAYHCAQLSYKTQYRTDLIIFPLILQTNIIAQMMSTGAVSE